MENNKIRNFTKKFLGNIGIAFAIVTAYYYFQANLLALNASAGMETESIKVLFIVTSAANITMLCVASVFGFLTLWYRINKLEKKLKEK